MAGLGLTIRMGASGTHVISPQGTVNITDMGRQQRGAFAEEISKALGLEQERRTRGRRGRKEFRRNVQTAGHRGNQHEHQGRNAQ
jgi:hypothetical protein